MVKLTRGLLLAITLATLTAAFASADEQKVPLDKLPKAVLKAVKSRFPKARLSSAVKKTAGGETTFEVTLESPRGLGIDVTLTPEGKITDFTREILAKEVPAVVADALKARYPKATVKSSEEYFEEEKLISYEFWIVTATKKMLEVSIDPKGKFLEEKEVKDAK